MYTIALSDAKLELNATNIPVSGGPNPGASVTFTANYQITQADKQLGSVSNTASVSAQTLGGVSVTDVSGTDANNDRPTVLSVPKPPVATNDTVEPTSVNQPITIDVLGNDSGNGVNLDPRSVVITQQPAHGTLTVNADGTVIYTATPGYTSYLFKQQKPAIAGFCCLRCFRIITCSNIKP